MRSSPPSAGASSRPSARRLELSGQLDEGRVDVRFAGGDPELVLVRDEAPPAIEAADEAYTARISLRLPESLKVRLEAAAAREGVSVNTWLVQALCAFRRPSRAHPPVAAAAA